MSDESSIIRAGRRASSSLLKQSPHHDTSLADIIADGWLARAASRHYYESMNKQISKEEGVGCSIVEAPPEVMAVGGVCVESGIRSSYVAAGARKLLMMAPLHCCCPGNFAVAAQRHTRKALLDALWHHARKKQREAWENG